MIPGITGNGFYGVSATATDPNFSSVMLLVGAEGADGSTTFTDESSFGRALTAGGNAQIDTAQSKFGTGSILLDGTGDYVEAADSNDWVFGTQFTVEAWVRFNANDGSWSVASQWGTDIAHCSWALFCDSNTLYFRFYDTGGTLRDTSGAFTASTGQWYHLAADRDASNVVRVYRDGNVIGTQTFSQTIRNGTHPLRLGQVQDFATYDLNGWLDEVRITKGVARYGGAFTPPTAAFPRS